MLSQKYQIKNTAGSQVVTVYECKTLERQDKTMSESDLCYLINGAVIVLFVYDIMVTLNIY